MRVQRMFLIAVLIVVCALTAVAQTGSGVVQGVVKDVSAGVIPGAKVTIIRTATMATSTTTTNNAGLFGFPPVPPGSYTIRVEAPGMDTWEGEFLLQVGQTAEISPVLKTGTVTTKITVAGNVAPLVDTSDATLSVNLEQARLNDLPENGRNIANLVVLTTPGVSGGQDGVINPIVNGLRDSMELYQDGAPIKNRDTGDFAGRLPGLDSVQEVQTETSLPSAKADRPAEIILSTRSGTNALHGDLFETNRDSAIGVARARTDYYLKPPHYVRNEFGGSVGGPVLIPKVYNGKNRTFFFTSYELLRQASASTTSAEMPTMAMRQGDFSGLVNNIGQHITIYDPATTGSAPNYTRQPFVNNQIPVSRESPLAKYLYSVMPAPTTNDNPLVANNYYGLVPSYTSDYMSTTRIDQHISDRDQLFGRFSKNQDISNNATGVESTNHLLNVSYGTYRDIGGVVNWTHTFSPTFLSETEITFSREYKFTGSPPAPGITNLVDYLGMPNPSNSALAAYQSATSFGTGSSDLNMSVQQMRQNTTNIFVFDENLTRFIGRHEIQFGGRFHDEALDVTADQPTSTATFDNLATALFDPTSGSSYSALPLTGFNGADFFLGYVSQYKETVKRPAFQLGYREYAGYVQDNWKVNSRLTLNFGLRYENLPAMTTGGNYIVGFDQGTDSMVLGRSLQDMYQAGMTTPGAIAQFQAIGMKFETASQAGLPSGLLRNNPWNFEPRLGFAYQIGGTRRPLVLRGGYGTYDSQTALRTWDNLVGSGIPYGYPIQYSVNNQAIAPDGLPNYELRSAPQYVAGANSQNVLSNPALAQITPGCCALAYMNPHQPPSLAQEWNFSMEREISSGIVARASYVGTHGSNLPQIYNFNAAPNSYVWYVTTGQPLPTGEYASTGTNPYDKTTYGTIDEYLKSGISNDNSINLQLERRYLHGWGFQFFYVMSNAFTDTTLVGNGGGSAGNGTGSISGSTIMPAADYLPGTVPQNFSQMDRDLFYARDPSIPHHQLSWNWVVDLPFGRDKWVAPNAGKVLNAVIGGWRLAGTGSYYSNYWSLPVSNWGPTSKVQVYGTKYKINDCSSGVCQAGYLYWNGYISPKLINETNAAGQCIGICGIPTSYTPAVTPTIPYGTTTLPANAPANTNVSTYWDTNTVWIPLKNGQVVRTTVNTNYNAWQNQYVPGPWTFGLNASLFKVFPLTETVRLRFNVDFFNVLNNPGLTQPSSDGVLSLQQSANSPRLLQLTARLTW